MASLLVTQARYVRFDILGPQTPRVHDGLGSGEVAFSVTPPDAAPVPEPESLVLIATGLGLLGVTVVGRRHLTRVYDITSSDYALGRRASKSSLQ